MGPFKPTDNKECKVNGLLQEVGIKFYFKYEVCSNDYVNNTNRKAPYIFFYSEINTDNSEKRTGKF